MNRLPLLRLTLLLVPFLVLSCQNPGSDAGTASPVLEFVFPASDPENTGLSADAAGTVDPSARTITVLVPASVTDRTLAPRISLAPGWRLLSPAGVRDFTTSPTAYVLAQGDRVPEVYQVTVAPAPGEAPDTALAFTEYYCGTVYALKGDNSQYLELTNSSAQTVDLGAYALRRNVWEAGVRKPGKDLEVPLKGTLAPGASLVIHSSRLNLTTFGTLAALPPASRVSDLGLNTIIAFTGCDGYQLVRGGRILDVLGPDGGRGTGLDWGSLKRMQRKKDRLPGALWDEADWTTFSVDGTNADAANAGQPSPSAASTDTRLTYFAFEGLVSRPRGTIDLVKNTVTVSVPEGTDPRLMPTVSTQGLVVWLNGDPVVSGSTVADFSQPVSLRVVAGDGTTYRDYQVVFSFYHTLGFTPVNYGFSGGIAAAVAAIKAGGTPNTNSSPVALNTVLEGILTAKGLYLSSSGQQGFTLQDGDEAVVFYTNDAAAVGAIPVGSRVRVPVTEGKLYYDMPEVTAFGTPAAVDQQIRDLYYRTGPYNSADAVGKVYRWSGSIQEDMDGFKVGTFEGSLFFHGTSALKSQLTAGTNGTFTGPVTYSYSQFRMELTQAHQITKP